MAGPGPQRPGLPGRFRLPALRSLLLLLSLQLLNRSFLALQDRVPAVLHGKRHVPHLRLPLGYRCPQLCCRRVWVRAERVPYLQLLPTPKLLPAARSCVAAELGFVQLSLESVSSILKSLPLEREGCQGELRKARPGSRCLKGFWLW